MADKIRCRKPRNCPSETDPNSKKKDFTSATFRRLGCTASSQVSVPAVIRTSANWEPKKVKNKRMNTTKSTGDDGDDANTTKQSLISLAFSSSSDVWCGPILTDVDCVISTRPARTKLDRILLAQREIVILRNSLRMSPVGIDRYRDLRVDTNNMSYEELLELGDRIGYVSTGLRKDEITHCLRRSRLATFDDFSIHFASETERKCSICQEEYEEDDETGTLNCGHFYHIYCIKQWLGKKNACPICKTAASSQT